MYGKPGSSSYNATHTNTTNSTIKTYVDNWYKNNIATKEYKNKVADVIYCNDRRLHYGVGYGTDDSQYSPFSRIFTSNYEYADTQKIELTCSQKNDRFTVSDTTNGNGALTYPVGLLTVDEILAAGGKGDIQNTNYYLYTGQYYWTMTPSDFRSTYITAHVFQVFDTGELSQQRYVATSNYSVRPVINIRSDVLISQGDGTVENPFILNLA